MPAGYLISHRINNSFTLVNRLLKAGSEVYWLKRDGTIWVPASPAARARFSRRARLSWACRWRRRPHSPGD